MVTFFYFNGFFVGCNLEKTNGNSVDGKNE